MFPYQAYVPDPVEQLDPPTTFEAAEAIAEAERAIRQLNADDHVSGLEAIGALLLRSEAIASSRIEGYALSQRDLARALIDPRAARGTARTVAANVLAMQAAVPLGELERPIAAADIRAVHRTLMADEPERVTPGEYRREQNWIGGRLDSPTEARYVPPPEDEIEGLMTAVTAFMNRNDLPSVAQAAIWHDDLLAASDAGFVTGLERISEHQYVSRQRDDIRRTIISLEGYVDDGMNTLDQLAIMKHGVLVPFRLS